MKMKELKKNAIIMLRKNIGTLVIVGIFMSLIIGEYIVSNDAFRNLKIVGSIINAEKEGQIFSKVIEKNTSITQNEYIEKIIYNIISGNTSKKISIYNNTHNVSKGIFFAIFNILTNGQNQFQNLVNSIANYVDVISSENLMVLIGSSLGLLVQIFILNPFLVGEDRLFLENINYSKTKMRTILFPFKKKRYLNIVKTIFIVKLYKLLWDFTIIGGIIKNYSYKMTTFIIAENPNIKSKDAINISRKMMDGYKMTAFKIDLSFLGWFILEYITFGLAGFFINPYYKACITKFYSELRLKYKEEKKENYELLNDEILYSKETLEEEYKEIYELYNGNVEIYPTSYIKKREIDYKSEYSFQALLMMFFIFSFVGWIWECIYMLIEQGILVNRGAMYGPWLPIYGFGCVFILIITKIKGTKKILKSPIKTFLMIIILCSAMEYCTSIYLEILKGVRYWDYTGIFLNINGRVCLENSIFFGIGGCMCLYFVGPFLQEKITKISKLTRNIICVIVILFFVLDLGISSIKPRIGDGITEKHISKLYSLNCKIN